MIACIGGGQIYSLGVGTTFDLSTTSLNYKSLSVDNFILIPKTVGYSATCTYKVEANNPFSYAQTHSVTSSGSLSPIVSYDNTTGTLSLSNTTSTGSKGTYSDINSEGNGSKAEINSTTVATYEVLVITSNIVSI